MRNCFFRSVMGIIVLLTTHLFAQPHPPDTIWTMIYGGFDTDMCHSVKQTSDGGFILGGETYSYGAGGSDICLLKTDADGNVSWFRTIGSIGSEACKSVIQTPDGGYALGGWTNSYGGGMSDMYFVKTDSLGNVEWQQTYGGGVWEHCYSLQRTTDNGYILGGYTGSFGAGSDDMYLVKTDSSGNLLWQQTFGGSGIDVCYSVLQMPDGGYALGGKFNDGPPNDMLWLVKTDSLGSMEWEQTYGYGSGKCYSLALTSDGGFILGGREAEIGFGNSDIYVVKTDSEGNFQWEYTAGTEYYDACRAILQALDGGFVISGIFDGSEMYIVKLDSQGEFEWEKFIGGGYNVSAECRAIDATSEGGYILGGMHEVQNGSYEDLYLVRLERDIVGVEPGISTSTLKQFELYPAHPNPFNPTTVISFELRDASLVRLGVFDLAGRSAGSPLPSVWYPAGRHHLRFNGANLSSGIYIYRISTDAYTVCRKMVLIK